MTEIKNDFHDAIASTRNDDLHKELGLMLQVETENEGSIKRGWKPRLRPPDAISRHS
jgi:hypothetical protein